MSAAGGPDGDSMESSSNASPEVDCQEAYKLLFDYLEGALPRATADAVAAHLNVCPACQEFTRSYEKTPQVVRQVLTPEVPEEVTTKLLEFLKIQRQK